MIHILAASLAVVPQFGDFNELTNATGSCRSLVAEDLDGDGNLDVVASSGLAPTLLLYRGLGGGAFASPEVLTGPTLFASEVTARDADGDGDLDLFAVADGGIFLVLIENLGGLQFAPPVVAALVNNGTSSLDVGDIDGDGDVDAVVSSRNRSLQFTVNAGGTFSPPTLVGQNTRALVARLGDIDGDGDLDVAFGGTSPPRVAWIENVGGVFGAENQVAGGIISSRDVLPSDVDGDGDLDLVVALEFDFQIGVYENLGGGTFGSLIVLDGTANRTASVATADIDGDGDLDVLGTQSFSAQWYENLGGLSFAPGVTIDAGRDGVEILAADLDGDGDNDVLTSPENAGLQWQPNTGTGSFTAPRPLAFSAADVRDLTVADADLDGDLDVFSASLADNRVALYENAGGGTFRRQVTISTEGNGASIVVPRDMNGDGLVDVVAAYSGISAVRWYPRTPQGGYGPGQVVLLGGSRLQGMDVADLDGDGDQDIAVGTEGSGPFLWYPNDGSGVFGAGIELDPVGANVRKVIATDLDGDGVIDVTAMTWSPRAISVYRGLGGGSFAPVQRVGGVLANQPFDVIAADLDRDGLQDFVLSSGNSTLGWMRNIDGTNYAATAVIDPNVFGELLAIDIDADQDLDVLIQNVFDAGRWFENDGSGGFTPRFTFTGFFPVGLRSPAGGDLDGDGDADLVLGLGSGGRILALPNGAFGEIGQSYCGPAVPNASGSPAELTVQGSPAASGEALALVARHVPANTFGLFFAGQTQGLVTPPGSIGRLCMSGAIGRYNRSGQIVTSGPEGILAIYVSSQELPRPNTTVPAVTGQRWNFQAWFRDTNAGATSNFTQGVSVLWN